ncbi:hypothetical protein Rsub_10188 [Raphidocelis subcapitata]|uniref:Uncharacterized protein n=1 Tax=Raphidocelis subcapitata TaxID=307507 RepID=A0A2V0PIJ5_9CHLO|nr:hypothetical protein Rsub_10188 [Raphidocelis subcapitata]|eukprot:GBF97763.1 hypothetical protein Rsub_10188 [Raphidocelis subcapitata]
MAALAELDSNARARPSAGKVGPSKPEPHAAAAAAVGASGGGAAAARLTRSQARASQQRGADAAASTPASPRAQRAPQPPQAQQQQQQPSQPQQQQPSQPQQPQPQQPSQQQHPQQQQQQQHPQQHPQQQQQPPLPPPPDIDSAQRDNPLAVSCYAADVYALHHRRAAQFRVPPDYLRSQPELNERMRSVLVDWLVEVHRKLKLSPESLFLAVSLLDRFLAAVPVARCELQLAGLTALMIASKYEDVWPVEVGDLVCTTARALTRAQLVASERRMLAALAYELAVPTPYQFLARLLKAAGAYDDRPVALYVAYCAERCLVDPVCLRHGPGELAAGVMYVALRAFGRAEPYPPAVAAHARVPRGDALRVAREVVRALQRAERGELQAVRVKYSTKKFREAAAVPPPVGILREV